MKVRLREMAAFARRVLLSHVDGLSCVAFG